MEKLRFSAKGIAVSVDLAVGHIADLAIDRGGRTLHPLHRAPWLDEPADSLPADLIAGQRRLSGDFLCAPFSVSDVEPAPLHGWPANSAWDVVAGGATADGWQARLRLRHKVLGATVDKILLLRDGHPFLYQEHVFSGGEGEVPVAHHPMTAMRNGGKLAFSPKRLALTPDQSLEPDPARGRSLLAYPARAAALDGFPTAAGGMTSLHDYSAGDLREDFVTLIEADHDGLGWTAVAREAEADLFLVLKNPRDLPVTMLWISNGGRDYAPWNGRHLGVLGVEDGRAAAGHKASIGDNALKREGVPTTLRLGGEARFRQVIGALPMVGRSSPPMDVVAVDKGLRLGFADGADIIVPFDATFLAQPLIS